MCKEFGDSKQRKMELGSTIDPIKAIRVNLNKEFDIAVKFCVQFQRTKEGKFYHQALFGTRLICGRLQVVKRMTIIGQIYPP